MASSINASLTAGVVTTADTSGVLNIQTAGVTAISIDASQAVSFTNSPTVTGGTANGVAYLNGSKVLTTGSALVFNGTNLGVGVSPSSRLTTSGATGTGNGLTIVDTDYSNDTHQIYGNNSLHISAGTGGAGAILFRTAGTERARFNSTGALVLAGGTTTANGIGITFPATQSASTNANTLDDYEEGTWSPNFTFSGASAGMSYTSSGTYTKIGNSVRVFGRVAFTNKGSSTGSALIQNLPFTNSSAGQPVYFIVGALTGISSQIQMYIDNGTTISMELIGSGSQSPMTDTSVTNGTTFYVSAVYAV